MPKLSVNGTNLDLPKNFGIQLNYFHPLFNEYGSRTNPVQLAKSSQNLKLLKHPDKLTKFELKQQKYPAKITHGVFQKSGDLEILQVKKTIETLFYFQEGNFAVLTENKTLKDVDYGGIIEMGASPQDVADFANQINYGGNSYAEYLSNDPRKYPDIKFCFPTIYAPNFYGDENVNNPDFSGYFNYCYPLLGGFIKNQVGYNPSSLIPCFFAFYILERIAATYGYTLKGRDILLDQKLNELILYNNYALDDKSGSHYVHVKNTEEQTLTVAGSPVVLDLPTEEDDDGDLWSSNAYNINEAGTHKIQLDLTAYWDSGESQMIEISYYKDLTVLEKVYYQFLPKFYFEPSGAKFGDIFYKLYSSMYELQYDDDMNPYYFDEIRNILYYPISEEKNNERIKLERSFNFAASEINKKISIKLALLKKGEAPYYAFYSVKDSGKIKSADLKISNVSSADFNRFKKTINPVNHVPDMDIRTFMQAMQLTTNTLFDYDDVNKEINIKKVDNLLSSKNRNDYSKFVDPESKDIDYNSIFDGVRLNYSNEIDLKGLDILPAVEKTLPTVALLNQVIKLKAVNAFFKCTNEDVPVTWEYLGPDNREQKFGTGDSNNYEIQFPIPPIEMYHKKSGIYNWNVPCIFDAGISKAYEAEGSEFYAFGLWKGHRQDESAAADFFCSTINKYDFNYNLHEDYEYSLQLDHLADTYENFISFLLNTIPVRYTGYLSPAELQRFDKLNQITIDHIHYIVSEMNAKLQENKQISEVEFLLNLVT